MTEEKDNYPIPEDLEAILNGSAPVRMSRTMDKRIIDWNQKRNGLEFKMDLELRMLQEEAQEFLISENIVEYLQEYSDFIFVYSGTLAKYYADESTTLEHFRQSRDLFAELQAWAQEFLQYAGQLLSNELMLLCPNDEEKLNVILNQSLEAVIKANEAKGTEKDENGKVKKGPNYRKPVEAINDIIKEQTGRYVR